MTWYNTDIKKNRNPNSPETKEQVTVDSDTPRNSNFKIHRTIAGLKALYPSGFWKFIKKKRCY